MHAILDGWVPDVFPSDRVLRVDRQGFEFEGPIGACSAGVPYSPLSGDKARYLCNVFLHTSSGWVESRGRSLDRLTANTPPGS
jgi:hypothetical protein